MSTDAQIRASKKYNKSRDYIGLRPDKEVGRKIREAAKSSCKSIQKYILDAVLEKISSEDKDKVTVDKKQFIR